MPPALNIPVPVEDLRAVQAVDEVVVRFTIPGITTEGLGIRELGGAELRIAEWDGAFWEEGFLARSRVIPVEARQPGPVELSIGVADLPPGELLMLVRLRNEAGRVSAWSNEVRIRTVPPLAVPQDLRAELAPEGIRLTWRGTAGREGVRYRIFRAGPDPAGEFVQLAIVETTEYVDTAIALGETYRYAVDAVIGTEGAQAVSERTQPVEIRAEDRFPPAPPRGLRAAPGIDSIELTWEAGGEADLAEYRVYRAEAGGEFERIAGALQILNYSDAAVESGRTYRYTVTAVDLAGNESARPDPVEITAP